MQSKCLTAPLCLGAISLFAALSLPSVHAQVPAFPGAQGFGAYATGGRGGTVYHVNNLNDSGPGSLRDAVSANNRTVVFDVGGYIVLTSPISCARSLTIAGQTAPGDGIGIMGNELSFSARSNEIVRFLRIRPGSLSPTSEDAINCGDGTNMIFDHLSMEFAPYNTVDAHGNTGANVITFQNTILANPISQRFNAHTESLGATFAWVNNIFSSGHNRNPMAKINTIYINNVIYNFQAGYTVANTSGHFTHDIINNYFIAGPSTSSANDAFFQMNGNQQIYSTGNVLDSDRDGALDGDPLSPGSVVALNAPWSPLTATIPTYSVTTAYKIAVSQAGVLPRDQVDKLVIADVLSLGSKGQLWNSQTATGLGNNGYGVINGGAALLDTDQDGMPDVWEAAVGLNANSASDGQTITASGYSQLELYLNWLAAPHIFARTNAATDIDLWLYTLGFTNGAVYTFSNITNGTVTLTNSHFAHFIPTTNFTGLASFDFKVVDSAGSSMTNTMGLLVASVHIPQNLVWHGDDVNNNWDTTTANWLNQGDAATFSSGDSVTLDDSGSANPALNFAVIAAPASVTVNASQNYTFSGTGFVTGSAALTKSGSGTLTLNTTNGYGGGTIINGGTVVLGTLTAAGSGSITLNGGTLLMNTSGGPATFSNPLFIATPSTLMTPGSGNNNEALSGALTGSATLSLNTASGGTFSARGSLTGFTGTLLLTGPGNFRYQGSTGSANTSFDLGTNGAVIFTRDGGSIALGSLTGAANTYLRGAGSTATATTYTIGGNNTSTTFAGTITNGNVSGTSVATAITKVGAGTLTLTGANGYTGNTTVSNGVLLVNGNNGSSPVIVANGGTLGGNGTIGGLLTVNSNGRLNPGSSGSPGTLTCANGLTLAGANLNFDLANSATPGGGVNDLVTISSGTLTFTGFSAFAPNLINGALANDTYTLISGATSISGSAANLLWGGPATTRQSFSFNTTTTPGSLLLVVGGTPAASLVWRGTNGNNWDIATVNWFSSSADDKYFNLDQVRFDDSSTNGNVVVSGTLQPALTTIANNSLPYNIGGGAIAGSTKILKTNAGTATLTTANSYTGGTIISGGILIAGTNGSFGAGAVTLSGGTLGMPNGNLSNAVVCAGAGTVAGNPIANATFLGPISGTGTLSINPPSGRLVTIQSDFSGFSGVCALTGPGILRFNPGNFVWGNSNALFDAGSGKIENRSLTAITVYLGGLTGSRGSQLLGSDQTNNPGALDTYVIGNLNSNTIFAGAIVDGSTHSVALTKTGSGTLTLSGNNSYTGDTTVNAGTLLINNTTGSGTGTGTIMVADGATLGGTGIIGGTVTVAANGTLAPGNSPGTLTIVYDLSVDDDSRLQFELGTNSDRVVVGGDLTLGGTLNLASAGGLQPGTYTLLSYGGTLSLGMLTFGTVPSGYIYSLDVSTTGQVNVIVSRPQFLNFMVNSGNVTANGSGGKPNAPYYVLTTTNVGLSLSNWTRVASNYFDATGNFSFTNTFDANQPQLFYLLQTP